MSLQRPHGLLISPQARAAIKSRHPRCIWLTGPSEAGKSTLASALEVRLHKSGRYACLLDGDNLRRGLCCERGMTPATRKD